jgi:hypothetical protein
MMYPLRVMASWPKEQTDPALEVTGGVTAYGPVSWVSSGVDHLGPWLVWA